MKSSFDWKECIIAHAPSYSRASRLPCTPLQAVCEALIPYQIYSFDILCLFDDIFEKNTDVAWSLNVLDFPSGSMLTTAAASKTFTSTSGHSTVVEASSNWTNSDFCPERILPAQESEGGLPWFNAWKILEDYLLLPGMRYRASQTGSVAL